MFAQLPPDVAMFELVDATARRPSENTMKRKPCDVEPVCAKSAKRTKPVEAIKKQACGSHEPLNNTRLISKGVIITTTKTNNCDLDAKSIEVVGCKVFELLERGCASAMARNPGKRVTILPTDMNLEEVSLPSCSKCAVVKKLVVATSNSRGCQLSQRAIHSLDLWVRDVFIRACTHAKQRMARDKTPAIVVHEDIVLSLSESA